MVKVSPPSVRTVSPPEERWSGQKLLLGRYHEERNAIIYINFSKLLCVINLLYTGTVSRRTNVLHIPNAVPLAKSMLAPCQPAMFGGTVGYLPISQLTQTVVSRFRKLRKTNPIGQAH